MSTALDIARSALSAVAQATGHEPPDKATKAFDKAVKAVEKAIADLAAGSGDDLGVARMRDKLYARYDKGEIRGRSDAPAFLARLDALSEAYREAVETGYKARVAARDVELKRLRQEAREAQPLPGSYEHELAIRRYR